MKTSADKSVQRAIKYVMDNGVAARPDEWVLEWSDETVQQGRAIVRKLDDGMLLSVEHEHFNLSPVLMSDGKFYRRVRAAGKSEWMELENGSKLLRSVWNYFNQMRSAHADTKR